MSTPEELVSIPDEPDTPEEQQLTVDERKALRMSVLSPLSQALEGRPFGHPQKYLNTPWIDQMTSPGIQYDPGNVTGRDGYDQFGGYVHSAVAALERMQAYLVDVIAAREKVKKDPTLTTAAQMLAVDAYATGRLAGATKAVDAAMASLTSHINEAEAQLQKGISGTYGGAMATEVRAHVKALANGARMKFMRERIDAGDEDTVAAVLKAKPFLSGLSQAEADVLLHAVNLRAQPDLMPRIEFMKKVLAHLERASGPFALDVERAIGVKFKTLQRLREAKQAAALY